eukprot:s1727_g17.t1
MTAVRLKCKGPKLVRKEGTSEQREAIVSLSQRLDLTDPLVQRQSTHELQGLIEEKQEIQTRKLRGGNATSSKVAGSLAMIPKIDCCRNSLNGGACAAESVAAANRGKQSYQRAGGCQRSSKTWFAHPEQHSVLSNQLGRD